MPPIGAIISVIATVAIAALKLGPILTAVLSTVVSIGIGFIAKALAPNPTRRTLRRNSPPRPRGGRK